MITVSFDIMDKAELMKLREPPKSIQGIYFLWEGDEIVYIGKSIQIQVRLWEHLNSPSHNLRGVNITGVTVLEIEAGTGLEFMESLYIKAYQPRLNKAKKA